MRVSRSAVESYDQAYSSLVRATGMARKPRPSIEAESIIAYAEETVVSEILEWPTRQKPGLRGD